MRVLMAKNKIFWTGNFRHHLYFPVLQKAFGHSVVPSSFTVFGEVKPMSNCRGVHRSPATECSPAYTGGWGGEGEESPGWKCSQVPRWSQSGVTLERCCCHRAQCVTQSSCCPQEPWPSLAALWTGWVGFLWALLLLADGRGSCKS